MESGASWSVLERLGASSSQRGGKAGRGYFPPLMMSFGTIRCRAVESTVSLQLHQSTPHLESTEAKHSISSARTAVHEHSWEQAGGNR
ncbi:hypothetical protein EYF80_028011 [Liparis tanakae]|uniref:Uncharacterized protein n=1 Tax=Liparis tanakae TaxID=230148 RepID=A0A4Z2H7L2_9TELE|nr:hypothetical protein EYF80_028011 [Liparis tanakae]